MVVQFNICMTIGKFADFWKIANITPIYKVCNPSSSPEDKSIYFLHIVSKLFEKVFLSQSTLLFDRTQYNWWKKKSFRENQSTELAITTIYDELLKSFDNKFITCSLFLDLSKRLTVVTMKLYLINYITLV